MKRLIIVLTLMLAASPGWTAKTLTPSLLARMAAEKNKSLPTVIGNATWERVEAKGMTMTHVYTYIPGTKVSRKRISYEKRRLGLGACEDQLIRPTLLDAGVTIQWVHYDSKGRELYRVKQTAAGCAQVETAAREASQTLAELLDRYCLRNQDDFSRIDKMITVEQTYKRLDSKAFIAMNPEITSGGKGYRIRRDEGTYLLSYVFGGGCAVATADASAGNVISILKKNYELRSLDTSVDSSQVINWYKFSSTSLFADGIILFVRSKDMLRDPEIAVNFLPGRVTKKMFGKKP